jgi:hypothetical protein
MHVNPRFVCACTEANERFHLVDDVTTSESSDSLKLGPRYQTNPGLKLENTLALKPELKPEFN